MPVLAAPKIYKVAAPKFADPIVKVVKPNWNKKINLKDVTKADPTKQKKPKTK